MTPNYWIVAHGALIGLDEFRDETLPDGTNIRYVSVEKYDQIWTQARPDRCQTCGGRDFYPTEILPERCGYPAWLVRKSHGECCYEIHQKYDESAMVVQSQLAYDEMVEMGFTPCPFCQS